MIADVLLNQKDNKPFRDFVDVILGQILSNFPIGLIKLVYETESIQKPNNIQLKSDTYLFLDYFQSNPVTLLKIIEMEKIHDKYITYVCPLAQNYQSQIDYVVFYCHQPLSVAQKENIESKIRLFDSYFYIYKADQQKKEEINHLEYLIQCLGHELRSPLSHINILSEIIKLTLPDAVCQEQIFLIQENVNKLNTVLTNILKCSKSVKPNLEMINLNSIIKEIVEDLQEFIKAKKLTLSYSHTEIFLTVDGFQFKQCLKNLLSNAIAFSPEGGIITFNYKNFQDEILISIADQGQGLSQEDLQNLFTPFYSRRKDGTGLGLTIVKKIILDHGGSIWADNLPEGGAKFSFSLPKYFE